MMTKAQIQREANKTGRKCWYATGDGGGWWISPDPKAVARRERNQAIKDLGLIKVRGALGGTYWE